MTAFKRSQAKYVKGSYKITNWPEYEAGLQQRGSLTVWISEDTLAGWGPPMLGRRKPGGQVQYSNHAIEIALTVGVLFHLRLRQTEGFLRSLLSLLALNGQVPDHTTISRRAVLVVTTVSVITLWVTHISGRAVHGRIHIRDTASGAGAAPPGFGLAAPGGLLLIDPLIFLENS